MLGFNPHRPRRAGATAVAGGLRATVVKVSILTGPEGPVQRPGGCLDLRNQWFQSSPAPKGRCNPGLENDCNERTMFQSSPAPKGRCNTIWGRRTAGLIVSILTGPEGPVQPSPDLARRILHPSAVSILTGPEGPVQRSFYFPTALGPLVSILTGPEGPVQPPLRPQVPVCRICWVSILTGPEGPVQLPSLAVSVPQLLKFQSSPAPKGRCNIRHRRPPSRSV